MNLGHSHDRFIFHSSETYTLRLELDFDCCVPNITQIQYKNAFQFTGVHLWDILP